MFFDGLCAMPVASQDSTDWRSARRIETSSRPGEAVEAAVKLEDAAEMRLMTYLTMVAVGLQKLKT